MVYNGYEIKLEEDYSCYSIRSIGKGALPKTLQGLFTTTGAASKAIDAYVTSKEVNKG